MSGACSCRGNKVGVGDARAGNATGSRRHPMGAGDCPGFGQEITHGDTLAEEGTQSDRGGVNIQVVREE